MKGDGETDPGFPWILVADLHASLDLQPSLLPKCGLMMFKTKSKKQTTNIKQNWSFGETRAAFNESQERPIKDADLQCNLIEFIHQYFPNLLPSYPNKRLSSALIHIYAVSHPTQRKSLLPSLHQNSHHFLIFPNSEGRIAGIIVLWD